VTEDWYFMSHRVPMARAAQRAGYDVHVITHVDRDRAAIEALGNASSVTSEPSPRRVIRAHNSPFFA